MPLPEHLAKLLDQEIERHHLQAARDRIHAESRECFYLHVTDERDLAVGRSRMGGNPDLPAGMTWPTAADGEHLTFLMQLNLGELPSATTNDLPASGMLYSFVQFEDLPHPSKVIYTADIHTLVNTSLPVPEHDLVAGYGPYYYGATKPHGIKILHGVEPPPYSSDTAQVAIESCPTVGGVGGEVRYDDFLLACTLTRGERERLAGKLLGRAEDYGGGNVLFWIAAARALGIYELLGAEDQTLEELDRRTQSIPTYITDAADAERWRKSNAIQREQLEWYLSHQNEFAEELSHWRLLWQTQSNFRVGLNIGDAGEWNVLIRDSDLAKRDFDHVVAIPQGH